MTFNVRNGKCDDGADSWELRKGATAGAISRAGADIIGLQEAFDFQVDYLASELPDYTWVGCGRDDGKCAGEFAPIFYRRSRFTSRDQGWFWLSLTPERPSFGWGARFTRIVTWVELHDAEQRLLVVNTHWDHESEEARLNSAQMIGRFVAQRRQDAIVLGDFNCIAGSRAYAQLIAAGLKDASRSAGVDPAIATFHAFKGTYDGGQIDWILHTPDMHTQRAWIDREPVDGRWPSDHFPVLAEIGRQRRTQAAPA